MSQRRLFLASCLSLTTCGMVFAIRSNIVKPLIEHFGSDAEQIGSVVGLGLIAMGAVILVASPLCDLLGMRRLLSLAFLLHVVGLGGFLLAPKTASDPTLFWAKTAMVCTGLAHGLVEGVINPLIATLYPDNKTHKLNVLHAWWPGGIILGGLSAYFLNDHGYSWQVQWCVAFVPTLLYGAAILKAQFPKTERVASGVSAAGMVKAALHPLFLLFVVLMAVTGSTELGTGSWLQAVLSEIAGFQGILLLVYGSGLMFVLRFFAGPIAHKTSPIGLLTVSAVLAAIGLFLLSKTHGAVLGVAAATVFYVGVCYFWPTMLGVVSERHPRTGALGMGLLGGSGMIGAGFATEYMGKLYKDSGPESAFQFTSYLPIGLAVVFTLLWLYDRKRGGYRAVRIGATASAASNPPSVPPPGASPPSAPRPGAPLAPRPGAPRPGAQPPGATPPRP